MGYVFDDTRKLRRNLNRLFNPIFLFNLKKLKFKLPMAETEVARPLVLFL